MTGFFAAKLQPVSLDTPGESGYFSSPTDNLDPHLFDGEHIKSSVRNWILNTLYGFWGPKYNDPRSWSRAWIAGSGVSYQWSASRGNGDLDVLIGVDFGKFFAANPRFNGFTPADVAEIFNQEFHAELWPKTDNQDINGQTYEVTFYVNPQSKDIRGINPYAAYNLTKDEWTVRPPTDFSHPQEYYSTAEREASHARTLAERFNTALGRGQASTAALLAAQASTLYDDIHLGRKQAFQAGGSGYGDYYNFRWQYHKQQGTAQLLHSIGEQFSDAQNVKAQGIYGSPITTADVALREAALWNRGGNGR